ncbi:MAG: globin family protein [Bacteroidota bacterium]
MTQHQQELVRTSFAKVILISEETTDLFYSRLFEIAPYIRPLFKDDLKEQGQKFMQTLHVVVNSLDNIDTISPALQKMGRDHKAYGVVNGHYDIVASALLWTLERVLGRDFTDEVRNAWVSMYTTISSIMKRAADEVQLAA